MLVSVVICTHSLQRWPLLIEALASLERQTLPPGELIVVVDGNDELRRRLDGALQRMTGFPVKALLNAFAPGLSGARNTGVDQAAGDVIAFLDDDALASDDWLETLAEGYDDEDVWGVGGHVAPRWLAERPSWLPEEFYWVIGCSYAGMPREATRVRNLHGCNASFRRTLFEEVGGFSPALGRRGSFLAGAEETELCLRASAARPDKSFLFCPRAIVFHAVTPDRTRWSYFLSRCFSEGRSKAWMVGSTGLSHGLCNELAYLRQVPRLTASLAVSAGKNGDFKGAERAAAVIVGTAATVGGFLVEAPTLVRPNSPDLNGFAPSPRAQEDHAPPAVSAIICTYSADRWTLIRRAIESLEHQRLRPMEIILAVDHNADLAGRLRQTFPNVRVVENLGPRGLSGARNAAIRASRGDVVAFLDDDASANPDWLLEISSAFADPRVAGVGGHTSPEWAIGRPTWWPEEFDWIVGASYRGMPSTRRFVRNVHGGNAAFRRTIFSRIGGFQPNVGRLESRPYGGEETELCIRARRMMPAARFVYEPAARIAHHVPPERTSLRYFVSRCYREGMSKAQIVRLEGVRAGLGTESAYVRTVLPRAALGAASSLRRDGDDARLEHAGVSVLGIFTAALGFLVEIARGFAGQRGPVAAPRIYEQHIEASEEEYPGHAEERMT